MNKLLLWIVVLAVLLGGALFSGLANPVVAWQVQRSLVASGMGEGRAECMAGRMVDRLSLVQLWTLRQAMAPREGEPERARGLFDSIKRLRRTEDGEIIGVVTTSAGLCAIGLG